LVLNTDITNVNLIIYPSQVERISFKHRDGRPRERIRLAGLEAMLKDAADNNKRITLLRAEKPCKNLL
jgi:hypothetical protein